MSFYDITIVQANDVLDSLTAILKEGEKAPNAASLPAARLHPDMFPLSFQVQIVTDLCIKLVARLAGQEPPAAAASENPSFAELWTLIDAARAALAKTDRATVDRRAPEIVTVGLGPGKEGDMSCLAYATGYVTPNLFFHLTATYSILRKEGVSLGKMVYLKPFIGKHASL